MNNLENHNINLKFEGLYETLENLCVVLDEENSALQNHDLKAASTKLELKQKLTKLYIEMVRNVASNPLHVANLDEDQRELFKNLAVDLEEKMKANKSLLKANMSANEKVIKAIVNTANRELQNESHAYSANGNLNGAKKNGGDTAFAFNKTL